jgi:hypothetical protein
MIQHEAIISGTFATAVMRWRQKWSVPSLADPRPVRALVGCQNGHGLLLSQIASAPTIQTSSVNAAEPMIVAQASLVAVCFFEEMPEVPCEMAQAAQHVVDQRPRVAEQHQDAEPRAEEAVDEGEIVRPARRGDQPPGDQHRADIKRGAGDAVRRSTSSWSGSACRFADAAKAAA